MGPDGFGKSVFNPEAFIPLSAGAIATSFVPIMMGVAGRVLGAMTGPAAPVLSPVLGAAGAGAGGAMIEASASFFEEIKKAIVESGGDPHDPATLQAMLNNPRVRERARTLSLARGGVIGAVDAISGGVAGRLTNLVPGSKKKIATAIGEIVGDSLLEGVGESAGTVAGAIAVGEDVDFEEAALGGLTEAVAGGGLSTIQVAASAAVEKTTPPEDVAIDTTTPEGKARIKAIAEEGRIPSRRELPGFRSSRERAAEQQRVLEELEEEGEPGAPQVEEVIPEQVQEPKAGGPAVVQEQPAEPVAEEQVEEGVEEREGEGEEEVDQDQAAWSLRPSLSLTSPRTRRPLRRLPGRNSPPRSPGPPRPRA
jgi:hypothetical protein